MPPSPLIIALDDLSESEAVSLARQLSGKVWGFKVNDLLLAVGAAIIPRLKTYGNVFCDPKLHDIPSTVANEVKVLAGAGADFITVHTTGGENMLKAALQARQGNTKILGISVPTSLTDSECEEIHMRNSAQQQLAMFSLAARCGLDGIICSPVDLPIADQADPKRQMMRVTPGVRPLWYDTSDDQTRVATPEEALKNGASFIVVGRPITKAADPLAAAEKIIGETPE